MRNTLAQTVRDLLDTELGNRWSAQPLAVAVSGGPDSVALAWACAVLAQAVGVPLHFFHVHHGLMADADQWVEQVERLARQLGATAHCARVQVESAPTVGLEAAARQARYHALCRLAREQNVSAVLLAHHQDDQVETLLFRLFRGTGLTGMAGMPARKTREGIVFLRPLLLTPRSQLLQLANEAAQACGIRLADDPSNLDPAYARGQLRQAVIPAIQAHWPGYRQTLLRFSQHCTEAEAALNVLTAQDYQHCQHPLQPRSLSARAVGALTPWRAQRVLRYWLQQQSVRAPTEQRLRQWHHQLTQSAPDRHLELKHERWVIHRFRDQVCLVEQRSVPDSTSFQWRGEAMLAFPGFGGQLYFDAADGGIDADWLRQQALTLDVRRGGERLRLHHAGPARTLKNLYQEAGVPPWERRYLPVLRSGAGVLFAGGCGQAADLPQAAPGIRLRWEAAS